MTDLSLSRDLRMKAATASAPVLLFLFMITMILPVTFELGGMKLSPLRLLLVVTFIPVVVQVLFGSAGPVRIVDILMLMFGGWIALTISRTEGIDRLPYGIILGIELTGGYFLGRFVVRSAEDWRGVVVLHVLTLFVMAPFVAVEFFTGRQLWAELLDPLGAVVWRGESSRPRFGFERVLTGFEHPILYGLYCSLATAGVVAIWHKNLMRTLLALGFVTGMTFASLSSGPFLAVMIQIGLMIWGWITRGRWWLLTTLCGSAFVFLNLASNRGPIVIFIETLTFNSNTGWTRLVQWEYGWASVMANPVFGIGLGQWYRPSWLGDSIDSFWLVIAMRHGLVALILLGLVVGLTFVAAVRAKELPPVVGRYRLFWTIGLAGLLFTLTTVHIWNAMAVFAMFYVGAGSWFSESQVLLEPDGDDEEAASQTPRYSPYRRNLRESPYERRAP